MISPSQRPLPDNGHNTHNRQTSMHQVGFEPTIPAGERPQTYALDRAATGTDTINSNRRNSNFQCSVFSKKYPIIRIFCIYRCFGVPGNPHKCSSTVLMWLGWRRSKFAMNYDRKIYWKPLTSPTVSAEVSGIGQTNLVASVGTKFGGTSWD